MVPVVRGSRAGKLREEMASPGGFGADMKGAQAGGEGAGFTADVPSTRKCLIVPLTPFQVSSGLWGTSPFSKHEGTDAQNRSGRALPK